MVCLQELRAQTRSSCEGAAGRYLVARPDAAATLGSSSDGLRISSATAVSAVPTAMARAYQPRWLTAFGMANTKTPPWGARSPTEKYMDRAPAAAEPRIAEGMTRSGSLAAKG